MPLCNGTIVEAKHPFDHRGKIGRYLHGTSATSMGSTWIRVNHKGYTESVIEVGHGPCKNDGATGSTRSNHVKVVFLGKFSH